MMNKSKTSKLLADDTPTPASQTSEMPQPDYGALSQELAGITARLEQGDLDVDAAVASYERGLRIIAVLETHLLRAENRVSQLKAEADLLDVIEEE